MAILGYDTNGASTDDTDATLLYVRFQAPSDGSSQTAVAHMYIGNATGNGSVALYADDSGGHTAPDGAALLAESAAIAIQTTIGDRSANISIPAITAGTFYWLGLKSITSAQTKFDAGGATGRFAPVAGGFENPAATTTGAWNNRSSVWIEYTASGGGTTKKQSGSMLLSGVQ